jgi:hypothetical protein
MSSLLDNIGRGLSTVGDWGKVLGGLEPAEADTLAEIEGEGDGDIAAILHDEGHPSFTAAELDAILKAESRALDLGSAFAKPWLGANYTYIMATVNYRTPQGKIVLPRAALDGSPVVARRFAPFTLKVCEWVVAREGVEPELPAALSVEGELLDHQIVARTRGLLADGQTIVFVVQGVYRFVLTTVKEVDAGPYEVPLSPMLNPESAGPSTLPHITSDNFYEDWIF